MKKNFWYTVGCVILLLAGGSLWFFLTVGENDPPRIVVEGDPVMIGKQKLLTATFSDQGAGLGPRRSSSPRTAARALCLPSTIRRKASGINR